MATFRLKADDKLLDPGVVVGRCPDTGVIHRLTITDSGKLTIERMPYVSPNPDGWTKVYDTLVAEARNYLFLIMKIRANPVDRWPLDPEPPNEEFVKTEPVEAPQLNLF